MSTHSIMECWWWNIYSSTLFFNEHYENNFGWYNLNSVRHACSSPTQPWRLNDVIITHETDSVISSIICPHFDIYCQCSSILIFQAFKTKLSMVRNDIRKLSVITKYKHTLNIIATFLKVWNFKAVHHATNVRSSFHLFCARLGSYFYEQYKILGESFIVSQLKFREAHLSTDMEWCEVPLHHCQHSTLCIRQSGNSAI